LHEEIPVDLFLFFVASDLIQFHFAEPFQQHPGGRRKKDEKKKKNDIERDEQPSQQLKSLGDQWDQLQLAFIYDPCFHVPKGVFEAGERVGEDLSRWADHLVPKAFKIPLPFLVGFVFQQQVAFVVVRIHQGEGQLELPILLFDEWLGLLLFTEQRGDRL
jgi:hypothetical protein